MKSFDERMAEISRRSEERIKERKRRRGRLLAICTPLVLCAGLYAGFILPADRMETADEYTNHMESFIEDTFLEASIVCAYSGAKIQDTSIFPAYDRNITDTAEVTNIFSVIQSLLNGVDDNRYVSVETDQENAAADSVLNMTENEFACTITFSTSEGEQSVYTLDGNDLVNESTGEKVVLTDAQLLELITALGLSE